MFGDHPFSGTDATQPQTDHPPVRILVVDDSAFMRKMLSEILVSAPDIEVVGTARDGEDALQKMRDLLPDVITLDVEMPHKNGVEFLEELMQERPTPVVMISTLTAEGADTTMACLQRGAVDFILKPSGAISLDIAKCKDEIIAKVRGAAGARVRLSPAAQPWTPPKGTPSSVHPAPVMPAVKTASAPPIERSSRPQETARPGVLQVARETQPARVAPQSLDKTTLVVAIASSTGGPAALHELIPHLPGDLNAAYVIVQHLPAGFTRSLAERLDRLSALKVREAQAGDALERGHVLIAPGGHHLELDVDGRVALHDDPPLWGVRPAADVMLRSVAAQFGNRVIGVILTGMGRDGALGAKAIQSAGGFCLGQDEMTCVVYGMPRVAFELGAIGQVVPLPEMAAALARQIVQRAALPEGGRNGWKPTQNAAA